MEPMVAVRFELSCGWGQCLNSTLYNPYTLTVVSLHLGRMALVPHTRTVSLSA